MFKFSGRRPKDLGVKNGKFTAAPTWKPNWVNSQVDPSDPHFIAPIQAAGDPAAVMAKVARLVQGKPRVVVVTQDTSYLHAEFSTPLMGYTDDVEFFADGKQLHVRSSSRLGVRDFNVNRKRVEGLRAALS